MSTSHKYPKRGSFKPSHNRPVLNKNKQFGERFSSPSNVPMREKDRVTSHIPESGETVRIIPLGGVEEVGRNMTAIEYKNDIFVIDAGFSFKDESAPGVDYILPNTKYLEERKHKIRAVLITHGHLDHIGALPYVMPLIGNPPIYTRLLTAVMIKKRQEEFPQLPPLDIRVVEKNQTVSLGERTINFFSVTHTIPDAMGIIIQTPLGNIVHTGDLKLEHNDGVASPGEEREFGIFKDMDVLCLLSDSTNVEKPGFSIPEHLVIKNIGDIVANTKGRLILGAFSSQLERLVKVIEIAASLNKKVVVEGRSMKTNIDIIEQLGMLNVGRGVMISTEEMGNYPPDRLVILATGAQGDEYGALMRAANKTHRNLKIVKGDVIILSSSIIPGNERGVQKLKDLLSKQGAKIIHYQTSDVHSSGHANRDEMAWFHRKIHPRFFIPIHGYHYMLTVHGELAQSLGLPKENVFIPDNGSIIEIHPNGTGTIIKEKAPGAKVTVDGTSVSDIQEVVIKDRQALAEDGMFVIVAVVDSKTGLLKKSPDIISRGFVYLKESQELLRFARTIIKKTIEEVTTKKAAHQIDVDHLKQTVTDTIGRFLLQKTAKRPVVIPVILSV